jgi:archaetidylinositol phosphate synthase
MLGEKREKFKNLENMTGKIFSKFFTPNQYTLISLLFVVISFSFLINLNLILALIFFLLATILDFIDGAVARFLQKATKRGAYLDTISDRYVEGIILLGFLFLPLKGFFFLPAGVWIFLALFGSLLTTYSKAAAKEKGLIEIEMKKGLLGRAERIILIFLAILLGIFNLSWLLYPIIILAIFSNSTALQRIYLSLRPGQN